MARVLQFDCFEADPDSGELRKRGVKVALRDQSFQALALLLERRRELVTRQALRKLLWRDNVFVYFDNNLNAIIAHLREFLGDSADHPRLGQTLPRRGYRFIGKVSCPV